MVWLGESKRQDRTSSGSNATRLRDPALGRRVGVVDLALQLAALERALTGLGIRFLEEELPEEAAIDGGLCRVGGQFVIYVSPTAPPWSRAEVLLKALRRLPHREIWLPPEIRRLLENEDFGDKAVRLIGLEDEERH